MTPNKYLPNGKQWSPADWTPWAKSLAKSQGSFYEKELDIHPRLYVAYTCLQGWKRNPKHSWGRYTAWCVMCNSLKPSKLGEPAKRVDRFLDTYDLTKSFFSFEIDCETEFSQ